MREFWLSKSVQLHSLQTGNEPEENLKDAYLHVREVNPAIDEAYEEMEKALESISKRGSGNGGAVVTTTQTLRTIANEALAKLKEARK